MKAKDGGSLTVRMRQDSWFLIFQMIYNTYITFFVSDKKPGNYFI